MAVTLIIIGVLIAGWGVYSFAEHLHAGMEVAGSQSIPRLGALGVGLLSVFLGVDDASMAAAAAPAAMVERAYGDAYNQYAADLSDNAPAETLHADLSRLNRLQEIIRHVQPVVEEVMH